MRMRNELTAQLQQRPSARLALVCVLLAAAFASNTFSQAPPPPKIKIPDPGVPQIMTMEGRFVRAAYNNEGYVILGYRVANMSVDGPWLVLEIGATVRKGVPNYVLKRDAISLETPDGKTIPLPSNKDYQAAGLAGLRQQADMVRDSINYFPPDVIRAGRIGFFADMQDRAMAYDQAELSADRGCVGRLYFPVEGGIKYGQHWLDVKFANSLVRVPFRILTKDEEKLLDKNYKSIEQQVKDAFAPKKP